MPRSLPAPRITLQEMFRLTAEKHPAKPEALGAHHKAEIEKWWPIIKSAGIKAD